MHTCTGQPGENDNKQSVQEGGRPSKQIDGLAVANIDLDGSPVGSSGAQVDDVFAMTSDSVEGDDGESGPCETDDPESVTEEFLSPSIYPTPQQLMARRESGNRFGIELAGGYIEQKITLDEFAAEGNEMLAQQVGIWLEDAFRKYARKHILNDALWQLIHSDEYAGNSIADYFDPECRDKTIFDLAKVRNFHLDGDEDTTADPESPSGEVSGHQAKFRRRLTSTAREGDLDIIREKLQKAWEAFFHNIPELKIFDACTAVGAFSVLVTLPVYEKYGLLSGGPDGKGRVRIWLNDVSQDVLDKTMAGQFDIPGTGKTPEDTVMLQNFTRRVFGKRERFEYYKRYLQEHATPVCCAIDDNIPLAEDFFDVCTIGFGYHHLPEVYAKKFAARNLIRVIRGGGAYVVADEWKVYDHGMEELHAEEDSVPLTQEWPISPEQSQHLIPIEEERALPDEPTERPERMVRIVVEDHVPQKKSHYNYMGVVKPRGSKRGLSCVMADMFFDHNVTEEE